MVVLVLLCLGGLIVCNGYKDCEYICLVLIGCKLGLQIFIVIEKLFELKLVLEEFKVLDVKLGLGVCMCLVLLGVGKWQNSGGDKVKFGLLLCQLLDLWKLLCDIEYVDCLNLLYFYMGLQIFNVCDIVNGMCEVICYFVELLCLGVKIIYVDVGGGLGVDYEGICLCSFCLINYGLYFYVSNIVQLLVNVCEEFGLILLCIVIECGCVMIVYYVVLIVNVLEVEEVQEGCVLDQYDDELVVICYLCEIYDELDVCLVVELFQEVQYFYVEGLVSYVLGQIDLLQCVCIDDLFYVIVYGVCVCLSYDEKSYCLVLDELNECLVDKYFVNFSVFELILDVWVIDQVFLIVLIECLDEILDCRGIIVDMICDLDGMVEIYVENESLDSLLLLYKMKLGESYCIGFFMVGVYQEILGDIYNLFGDIDVVEVLVDVDGYVIIQQCRGDIIDVMLDYVGYCLDELCVIYVQCVVVVQLLLECVQELLEVLEVGLIGYIYLFDELLV